MNGDFTVDIKRTLAKRAGEKCSLCGIGTSKPHSDADNFINLGEAAHIKGKRRDKFNRYDERMTDTERSSIENGIWLCRTCHKKIDRDDKKYTVDFLTTTKAKHEQRVDCGFYDQKFPDHEPQQKVEHDQKIFNLSQEVFNEVQLNSFLDNLSKYKFVYWEDEDLKKVNDFLEFHNLENNRYLIDDLNSSFSDLRFSINGLLIKLYSIEEKDKRFNVLFQYPLPDYFFINMQPPPEFKFSLLHRPSTYYSYRNKFNSYASQIDRHIKNVKSSYSKYRQVIKTTIYV